MTSYCLKGEKNLKNLKFLVRRTSQLESSRKLLNFWRSNNFSAVYACPLICYPSPRNYSLQLAISRQMPKISERKPRRRQKEAKIDAARLRIEWSEKIAFSLISSLELNRTTRKTAYIFVTENLGYLLSDHILWVHPAIVYAPRHLICADKRGVD